MVILNNDFIRVNINEFGAEIKSIMFNGREQMWEGKEEVWSGMPRPDKEVILKNFKI